MVLLLSNGFARAWHEARSEDEPPPTVACAWPPRVPFVPQKTIAKQRLMVAVAASAAALVLAILAVVLG